MTPAMATIIPMIAIRREHHAPVESRDRRYIRYPNMPGRIKAIAVPAVEPTMTHTFWKFGAHSAPLKITLFHNRVCRKTDK